MNESSQMNRVPKNSLNIKAGEDAASEASVLEQAIQHTLKLISKAACEGISLERSDIKNVLKAQKKWTTNKKQAAFWLSAPRISKAIEPFKQEIRDTLDFVSYAAHKGIVLNQTDIENVVKAQSTKDKIEDVVKAKFWCSASRISKAIEDNAPFVTIESIRASQRTNTAEHGSDPYSGAWATRRSNRWTSGTLAALLLFQIYWLVGATITTDISEIRKRLEKLKAEEISRTALPEPKKGEPNLLPIKTQQKIFESQLEVEKISADTNFYVLKQWNVMNFPRNLVNFLRHFWKGTAEATKGTQNSIPTSQQAGEATKETQNSIPTSQQTDHFLWVFTRDNVLEMQKAQIILIALIKYILPILYGFLGASAYIGRTLAQEIVDHQYHYGCIFRYVLRYYLGGVAGLSIAWFTSDSKSAESAGILQSLSPLALAFLAGYGIELLFSLLDRIVSAFSSAGPVQSRRPAPPGGAGSNNLAESSSQLPPGGAGSNNPAGSPSQPSTGGW